MLSTALLFLYSDLCHLPMLTYHLALYIYHISQYWISSERTTVVSTYIFLENFFYQ
jgi:hypothetical protein